MKILDGGLELVPGYTFSAIECGIKYAGRLDFSLIFSEKPCRAAGAFTTNRIFAAPVRLCRERIGGTVHGVLINATNANACTGDEGYRNAVALTRETALKLAVPADSLLMASTGVIGVQLPADKMRASVPSLVGGLSREAGAVVPRAIMTTDTYPKAAAASFETSAGAFTIAGTAKGVGMIAPNMATLLAFLVTDAPLAGPVMDGVFGRCIARSLNAITIDGDMSTNDTAILLAPRADAPLGDPRDAEAFEEALLYVLTRLAELLVRDGEGATKFVTVDVTRAESDDDARRAARSIAESLLVKTALFGNDPNWGRIACAAGYSGAALSEDTLSVSINGVLLLSRGVPQAVNRKEVIEKMSVKDLIIELDIGRGTGSARFYTSDISYDYVKINAEYTT
ncbi:MAG: bifunctional glutamate N-acetyltransferase/amino-acid acetyltransferase ArgJ [Spirochaetes bacterium]|nr:MAG: bifunctional glutamate N-acetyltransferase/amino-acid acetyltransferase ArgJ [Spirochaetota bacterium]